MSVPVPVADISPKAPGMILMVFEPAAPPPPTRAGAAVNVIVATPAPGVFPRFVPLKRTVAPDDLENAELPPLVNARVAPAAPGVTVTIQDPAPIVSKPTVSDVAAALPVKLSRLQLHVT